MEPAADQILLFMALTEGYTSFTTTRITGHLLTNLWVIKQFLHIKTSWEGEKDKRGKFEFFNE
jgi:RNA 3'-terminal phosphate cyclase (ATP)